MRRWIALLLFFSLLITPLRAGRRRACSGGQRREVYCPEGSDAQTAQYVYRYQYPLLENTGETAQMINDFYDYLISDAKDFMIPMTYETLEVSPVQAYTAITSQVMCNNEDYFSVLVTTESFMGAETSQILAGHTLPCKAARPAPVFPCPTCWACWRLTKTTPGCRIVPPPKPTSWSTAWFGASLRSKRRRESSPTMTT